MIRFALVLLMSLALSSQVVAAVKWNNSSSSNSSSNKNSAAHWATTPGSNKDGFICSKDPSKKVTYTSQGRDITYYMSGEVTIFAKSELPNYLEPCVNDETLEHYYSKWLGTGTQKYDIKPGDESKKLKQKLLKSEFLSNQLENNEILSYLYYDNGIVKYDQVVPENRFGFQINNKTLFRSNSVGKSFISYMVGHAICEGHIGSVNHRLNDWPLIKASLYSEQKLIDLLNMRARDQHVVTEADGFIKTGRWFNPISIKNAAADINNTKPAKTAVFNYNGFTSNLIMSYVRFKVGDNWDTFLNKVFKTHIGISERFVFQKANGANEKDGLGSYSAYASRYDYLRLAIAILNDWHDNNCVGQYLKEIENRKMPISEDAWFFDMKPKDARNKRHFSSHYGGQFYFNYTGMKKRNIIGMEGKGGQSVLIDLDNRRIVVINAANDNYDWYELAYQAIKTGKLRDK